MNPMHTLYSQVLATARRHRMFDGAAGVVLAVSGGSDSMALLHLLHELRRQAYPELRLHAAHLHHGIRGVEADEDAQLVQREAARLGVACTIEHADVPACARAHRLGLEEAGRELRYAFLVRTARKLGFDRIATGHQADDQAETVLMRVRRGAGARGLGGIPYVREAAPHLPVVRPLLDVPRRILERFLHENALPSRLDATNLSPDYLRNRMRHQVIPALERDWRPRLREDLVRLARLAQRLQTATDSLAGSLAGAARVADGRAEIDASILSTLPRALAGELVRRWMQQADLWRRMLTRRQTDDIVELVHTRQATLSLPGHVQAAHYRGVVTIQRQLSPQAVEVELSVPDLTPLPTGERVEAAVLSGGMEWLRQRTPGGMEEYFDADRLAPPLAVRSPRPGDRMRPLGAPGTRKLQDILTDLHIARWRRARLLLVTMQDRPIWIVGCRTADAVKLTAGTTRVLRLRVLPEAQARAAMK